MNDRALRIIGARIVKVGTPDRLSGPGRAGSGELCPVWPRHRARILARPRLPRGRVRQRAVRSSNGLRLIWLSGA